MSGASEQHEQRPDDNGGDDARPSVRERLVSCLHAACQAGDVAAVRGLVAIDGLLGARDEDDNDKPPVRERLVSCLHAACQAGDVAVVRGLVAIDGLLNARDGDGDGEDGLTPLEQAAKAGQVGVILELLRHEFASSNVRALKLAAEAGHVETCARLVEAGGFVAGLEGDALAAVLDQVSADTERLDTLQCQVNAAAMEALVRLSGLERLSMFMTAVGPENAAILAEAIRDGKLSQLTRLTLVENGIGADGAVALATAIQSASVPRGTAPQLEWLDLSRNDIGDRGAAALTTAIEAGSLPKLEVLDVGNNDIGDQCAVALATAFGRMNADRPYLHLELQGNRITDQGAAEAEAAMGHRSLAQQESLRATLVRIGGRACGSLLL